MARPADVIIVGAGVFGLCAAWHCASRGLRVRVLEAGSIGSGASGGIVGALSPHTPDNWNEKKQFQFEALSKAKAFWNAVDRASGLNSGYGRVGRICPILTERGLELARARAQSAQSLWQDQFTWSVRPAPAYLNPSQAPFGVIHDTLSGRIYPKRAVSSLQAALHAMSVEISAHHRVTEIAPNCVKGPWGQVRAQAIILAAGTGGFDLLQGHFDTPVGGAEKGQAALLDADFSNRPTLFADGIYIIPHDQGGVAVGSTSEREWDADLTTDHRLDDVIAKARRICPELQSADVTARWAGLRPKARRRNPLLGRIKGLAGIYLALGGYKIGFGIAHHSGHLLAEMITTGRDETPQSFTLDYHLS